MCESGYGRVINITSMSVVEPIENLAVSTAMRAALTANTKTLAREVAGKGVTLNSVMPGVIHTGRIEFLRQKKAERDGTSLAAEMQATRQSIPAGRLGKPEEVGALIAFLASQQASYITGQNIAVDGGLIKSW
jgi:3-oxoacyl-[acyl-carrier protein] reductase